MLLFKRFSILIVVAILTAAPFAGTALADNMDMPMITYLPGPANPADTPILGTMIDPSGYYRTDSGDPKAAGNTLDNRRLFIIDDRSNFKMMKWDMGFATNFVRVYPDIDHSLTPGYGNGVDLFQWSLWGSNNPAENMCAWTLLWDVESTAPYPATFDNLTVATAYGTAISATIYRHGDPSVGTISDAHYSNAFTIDFLLPDIYRFFGVSASTLAFDCSYTDPEINAVATATVPLPSTLTLLGCGLLVVGGWWRFRKI